MGEGGDPLCCEWMENTQSHSEKQRASIMFAERLQAKGNAGFSPSGTTREPAFLREGGTLPSKWLYPSAFIEGEYFSYKE